MNKLLFICGPTATGKTDVGIKLAKTFTGEIVSADSRQVYRGMDVVTGKDLPASSKLKCQNSKLNINNEKLSVGFRVKEEIPIWLVDIVDPDYPFNVGEYSILAHKVIRDIWLREKLPIVVGGTGLYIKSIIEPFTGIIIPPNKKLRRQLEGQPKEVLQQKLIDVDSNRWEKMNHSDRNNPRRLIRAIEIVLWKKNNSFKFSVSNLFRPDLVLMIGLNTSFKKTLYQRIDERVEKRLKEEAPEEVINLISKRYSWFLPSLTASGAKQLKEFIEGKETLFEACNRWKFAEHAYARRQITWFKKDKRIHWFDITQDEYLHSIEELVRKWYTSDRNLP